MKTCVFGIYDLKAKAFMQPFFSVTDGTAVRAFGQLVNEKGGHAQVYNYPEDFVLFRLGTFDDESGALAPLNPPVQVVMAAALKSNATL